MVPLSCMVVAAGTHHRVAWASDSHVRDRIDESAARNERRGWQLRHAPASFRKACCPVLGCEAVEPWLRGAQARAQAKQMLHREAVDEVVDPAVEVLEPGRAQ